MNGKICFTRDAHGGITLSEGELKAFHAAARSAGGHGLATRLPRELRDAASSEYSRKVAQVRAANNCDYETAEQLARSANPELFFACSCQVANDAADADVTLAVAR